MKPSVFLSYAHADIDDVTSIKFMLDELQRDDKISLFHDGEIRAGQLWDAEIESHLREATCFLIGISDDYIVSDYVRTKELPIIRNRMDAGAKVLPLLIKGRRWQIFLKSDGAKFLSSAQFWPVVRGRREPLCDLSSVQQDQALEVLREQVIATDGHEGGICEPAGWWSGSREKLIAGLAELRLPDSIDVRIMPPSLPGYLAEALASGSVAELVREANELLYAIDNAKFPKRRIPDPPFNIAGSEESYWSEVLLELSQRSSVSIVVLLALAAGKNAVGVTPTVEGILKASESGGTT